MPPLRVLVVDDEEPVRKILVQWITKWGYEAVAVASADAAIAEMERLPADILIADLIMPIHDGLWLLGQVRQRWPGTIMIVESGVIQPATILKTKAEGASDFLPKPFGRESVYQALQRAAAHLQRDS